jgi:hypothetical protein
MISGVARSAMLESIGKVKVHHHNCEIVLPGR